MQGFIDSHYSPDCLGGWVYEREDLGLIVRAILDDQVLAEASAKVFRPDLAAKNGGNVGFELRARNKMTLVH